MHFLTIPCEKHTQPNAQPTKNLPYYGQFGHHMSKENKQSKGKKKTKTKGINQLTKNNTNPSEGKTRGLQ